MLTQAIENIDSTILALKLWDKKSHFLKNKPEKSLKTKVWPPKTNPNEPENEAEKLLKTLEG